MKNRRDASPYEPPSGFPEAKRSAWSRSKPKDSLSTISEKANSTSQALRTLLEEILPRNTAIESFEVKHNFARAGPKTLLLNARRIPHGREQAEMILLALEDAGK